MSTHCPNEPEIIAYAVSRGITDANLQHEGCFGWHLCSKLNLREGDDNLLWVVANEMKLTWGGGSSNAIQVKPEKFVQPWTQDACPYRPGKPLQGYLGCPVVGERVNSKQHPGFGCETVDTLCLRVATEEASHKAVAHFQKLGYLCWIESNVPAPDGSFGAALYIPKLNHAAVEYDRDNTWKLEEIETSLRSALAAGRKHFERVGRAILGIPSVPHTNVRDLIGQAGRLALGMANGAANASSVIAAAAKMTA